MWEVTSPLSLPRRWRDKHPPLRLRRLPLPQRGRGLHEVNGVGGTTGRALTPKPRPRRSSVRGEVSASTKLEAKWHEH